MIAQIKNKNKNKKRSRTCKNTKYTMKGSSNIKKLSYKDKNIQLEINKKNKEIKNDS